MPFVMLAILGALFYLLFIKGYMWKILLLTIVPYYGSMLLGRYIPALSNTAFIITPLAHEHIEISWAFMISFALVIIVIGFFGKRD
jgi:hypothetical protein